MHNYSLYNQGQDYVVGILFASLNSLYSKINIKGTYITYTISKTVLIDDCCLLFDSEIINYVDFLDRLSPRKLRSAYRRKAFATHPDRSHVLGEDRENKDDKTGKINNTSQVYKDSSAG